MMDKGFKEYVSKKNRRLSILLTLWVYIYASFYFIPLIISSNTYLMYVVLLGMILFVVLDTLTINKNMLLFGCCYVLIAIINVIMVSYKYYVFIDAFSGLMVFLPALLVISSNKFNLLDFAIVWSKFAIFATIFSPIAVILLQNKQIDYGVFTYLNLPNAIIFSYMAIIDTEKKDRIKYYLLAVVNVAIILLFGGRMAALAATFSVFLSYLLSLNTKKWKKLLSVFLVAILVLLAMINLEAILLLIKSTLDKYNFSSRTIALLLEQIRNGNTGVYLSGRDVIYDKIIEYIDNRCGLPGGFGISLAISEGKFYHPHNLFLQLSTMIGVLGTILFFILVIVKLVKKKQMCQMYEFKFIVLLLLDYILISLSGGSILTNFVAIIGFGMVFFYKPKKIMYVE